MWSDATNTPPAAQDVYTDLVFQAGEESTEALLDFWAEKRESSGRKKLDPVSFSVSS